MKVAILILNFNGKHLLLSYLDSIISKKEDAEIWVIDNGSTDDSIDVIKNKFSDVKVLVHEKNYGYAKGYNLAVSKINADLYCFLNNDVRIISNLVTPMRELFKTHKNLGFAQPKIVSDLDESIFEYAGAAGGHIDMFGFPFCRGRYLFHCQRDLGQYDSDEKITWASGAAFWVRKTAFNDLGGFDEKFFMYFEEIDLCLRGKTMGWITMCNGKVKVAHLGGGTMKFNQSKKLFYNIRNSLLTYTKTINPLALFFLIIFRVIFDFLLGFLLFFSFKFRQVRAIIKAYNQFIFLFPETFLKRKKTLLPFHAKSVILKFLLCKLNF